MHFISTKNILPIFLIFISACAKEVYTNEDAANSKREAQKVGLTVMVRDINGQTAYMDGFTVSSSQCGDEVKSITSVDGMADLMVIKGDVVLIVKKEGYVTVTAVVTTNETDKERNNTVVVIPIFADTQQVSGILKGLVSVKTESPENIPVANALVSIHIDMDELMNLAFPGLGENPTKYRPGVLSYSMTTLMQPMLTNIDGEFLFAIPSTVSELTYTLTVHETALTQNIYCSGNQPVVTNGWNVPTVSLQLIPYEK